jgi:hypothetical protein
MQGMTFCGDPIPLLTVKTMTYVLTEEDLRELASHPQYQADCLMEECRSMLESLDISSDGPDNLSEATRKEYWKVSERIIRCGRASECYEDGAGQEILSTLSASTFYKRVAAMRFRVKNDIGVAVDIYNQGLTCDFGIFENAVSFLQLLRANLATLRAVTEQGLCSERRKKRSKRIALRGLPTDWREQICRRGANGRYGNALWVTALTGCRPAELKKGIEISFCGNSPLEQKVRIHVKGAKVRKGQGQDSRSLIYVADGSNPATQHFLDTLRSRSLDQMTVAVKNGDNFSAEIRRLAALLWPRHPHHISAICFRHQIAADAKKHLSSESASALLGHRSARTKKNYGTAAQARSSWMPVAIEVPHPIVHLAEVIPPSVFRNPSVAPLGLQSSP